MGFHGPKYTCWTGGIHSALSSTSQASPQRWPIDYCVEERGILLALPSSFWARVHNGAGASNVLCGATLGGSGLPSLRAVQSLTAHSRAQQACTEAAKDQDQRWARLWEVGEERKEEGGEREG